MCTPPSLPPCQHAINLPPPSPSSAMQCPFCKPTRHLPDLLSPSSLTLRAAALLPPSSLPLWAAALLPSSSLPLWAAALLPSSSRPLHSQSLPHPQQNHPPFLSLTLSAAALPRLQSLYSTKTRLRSASCLVRPNLREGGREESREDLRTKRIMGRGTILPHDAQPGGQRSTRVQRRGRLARTAGGTCHGHLPSGPRGC